MSRRKKTHEQFLLELHNINPDVEILSKYVDSKTHLKCRCKLCGYTYDSTPSNLLHGYRCKRCFGSIKKTQEEFEECVHKLFPNLEVIGEYKAARFKVLMHCNVCGGDWEPKATHVLSGHGCPYCAGRTCLSDFNDMWTTAPEIAKLLVDPEYGYKYTKSSERKVYFRCPDCGDISFKRISNVYHQGLCCQKCSDGISYPNKFIRAFLNQLPIYNLYYEYYPDWARPYFYDDYFEYNDKRYLIEADGEQHYKNKVFFGKMLEERQKIDNNKTMLATENGFILIRIDCSKSTKEYMKNSICNSMLNDIFDLRDIDWGLCDTISHKNIIKEVSFAYENTTKDMAKLREIFNLAQSTICSYLKIGYKCGWCGYTKEQSNRISRFKNMRPFVVIDNNVSVVHYFNGTDKDLSILGDMFNNDFLNKCIKNACRIHRSYKNVNFRYADEYLPKEIIDEIKLQDNSEELFFNYLNQKNTQQND